MAHKNKEDRERYRKEYYQLHKNEIKEKQRKYCSNNKAKRKKYFKDHAKERVEYTRRRRADLRLWYYKCISEICCVDCNYSFRLFPTVAQFHHVIKNSNNIQIQEALNYGYDRFCLEAEKGEYLCPTCHRIRHILGE